LLTDNSTAKLARSEKKASAELEIQIDIGKLPAQKAGGLYKTKQDDFVEAVPSRASRDGTGTFPVKREFNFRWIQTRAGN